jgi:hypothetical protein
MSSPPSINNTQLPLDVLGCIFYHYAGKETIRYPLETLLLVCRFWNFAALAHRTLWNDIKIYIGHSPTSKTWRKRLPLRLARAGPAIPLFITLFNVLDLENRFEVPQCVEDDPLYSDYFCRNPFPASSAVHEAQCPCYNDARECAEFVLECLAGTNGELCARWKEFHVDLGYGPEYDASRSLARALSYPAPLLTSLVIANIDLDKLEDQNLTPLIQMPQLQVLMVKDCYLLQVPNFRTLIEVELDGTNLPNLGACSDLRSASQLQVLCLRHIPADGVILPEKLPNLNSIEIIGGKIPISLHSCQIPNLSIIALDFDDHNPILDILACPGINIRKLQKLSLIWADMDPNTWPLMARQHMVESLHELATRAPNLSYIAGNHHIVILFLKILWDSWSEHGAEGILGSKQFSLHLITYVSIGDCTGGFAATFTGNPCPGTLVTLAKKWGLLSPHLPISELLSLLPVSQLYPEYAVSNHILQN